MSSIVIKQHPLSAVDTSETEAVLRPVLGSTGPGSEYLALAVGILSTANGANITDRQPSADGVSDTTPRGIDVNNYGYFYDPVGDAWDRKRGNHSGTLLASAARTASVASAAQVNYNARGVHVIINVSAYPAAASVVPTIQGYDPLSASYYDILTGAAIVATGYTVLKVYPGIGAIVNGAASDILPRNWRINMAHADADSITYSVGFQVVL